MQNRKMLVQLDTIHHKAVKEYAASCDKKMQTVIEEAVEANPAIRMIITRLQQ